MRLPEVGETARVSVYSPARVGRAWVWGRVCVQGKVVVMVTDMVRV